MLWNFICKLMNAFMFGIFKSWIHLHISVPLILDDFRFLNLQNKGYRTVCKFFVHLSYRAIRSKFMPAFYWVWEMWFSSLPRIGVRGPIKPQLFSYQKFSFKVLLIPFLYSILMKAEIRIRQHLLEQAVVLV